MGLQFPNHFHIGLNKAADRRQAFRSGLAEKEGCAMTDYEILMIVLTFGLLIVEILKMKK